MKLTIFGERIKELREQHNILQREVAAALQMDTAMLSKIERGERKARKEQIKRFAHLFKIDQDVLLTLWFADQVYEIVKDEKNIEEIFLQTKAMTSK